MSDEDNSEENEEGLDAEAGEAGEDDEYGDENAKSGLSAKKIVLFFVLPFFLLIAVGGGLYFTGVLDSVLGKTDEVAEGEEHAGKDGGDKKKDKKGKDGEHGEGEGEYAGAYFLQIPNMIVNLSSADGQTRYLRLSVQLELATDSDKTAVEAVMPRVVDQFQTYLRELRITDLRGSQGIYRLQMELLARVNAAAYPIEVQDVLFQEILIQ